MAIFQCVLLIWSTVVSIDGGLKAWDIMTAPAPELVFAQWIADPMPESVVVREFEDDSTPFELSIAMEITIDPGDLRAILEAHQLRRVEANWQEAIPPGRVPGAYNWQQWGRLGEDAVQYKTHISPERGKPLLVIFTNEAHDHAFISAETL
ncbi:MAG: hypothetical protein AAF612_11175 [Planctomycetota bacterium]